MCYGRIGSHLETPSLIPVQSWWPVHLKFLGISPEVVIKLHLTSYTKSIETGSHRECLQASNMWLIPGWSLGSFLINWICWCRGHASASQLWQWLAACYKGPSQKSASHSVKAKRKTSLEEAPKGFMPQKC